MLRSLVGSEMCIRDRYKEGQGTELLHTGRRQGVHAKRAAEAAMMMMLPLIFPQVEKPTARSLKSKPAREQLTSEETSGTAAREQLTSEETSGTAAREQLTSEEETPGTAQLMSLPTGIPITTAPV